MLWLFLYIQENRDGLFETRTKLRRGYSNVGLLTLPITEQSSSNSTTVTSLEENNIGES
jgi:hypothetical protein